MLHFAFKIRFKDKIQIKMKKKHLIYAAKYQKSQKSLKDIQITKFLKGVYSTKVVGKRNSNTAVVYSIQT